MEQFAHLGFSADYWVMIYDGEIVRESGRKGNEEKECQCQCHG